MPRLRFIVLAAFALASGCTALAEVNPWGVPPQYEPTSSN
jgi:hypothetical protein